MSYKRFNKFAVSIAVGFILTLTAGCELMPVYLGDKNDVAGGSVSGLSQKLATIAFDEPNNRAEQIIFADLSFRLHGSVPEQVKLFTLKVAVSAATAEVSPVSTDNPEKAYRTTLTANFSLIDNSDYTVLLNESRFSSAQFSRSNQTTANAKATEKAEEQAAMDLSNMIRARLTAYFSAGS